MTYLIKNPFFGSKSVSYQFNVTDSEELYTKNLMTLGDKWFFYNKKMSYELNSLGYRMNKNLEDINYDSYIAFFGCSITVGVGLPLEDTFSYRIAKELNVDYINAGIPGASPTFVNYNLVTLLDSVPKLPKIVVIYWPDIMRLCYWEKDTLIFYLPNWFPHTNYWHDAYRSYIIESSHVKNNFLIIQKTVRQLCKANNIKLFEFTTKYLANIYAKENGIELMGIDTMPLCNSENKIDWINLAYARDVELNKKVLPEIEILRAHPGIYHQDKIVEEFFKTI